MVYTKTVWAASTAPGISADNLNNLETQYDCAVVIGEIKLYAGSTAPVNFFLCNGTSYSVALYPALFAVTSHYFGGTTAWAHLPNMVGHFPVGFGGAGSYATVGSTGGEETHALTEAELATHSHPLPVPGATPSTTVALYQGLNIAGYTTNSGNTGSGTAHENRPPYVVLNYIIRYQ